VLLGLLPFLALVANLASRFDAGASVWHDLLLMLADGQIGPPTALLVCLLAGSGVAIVAAARRVPAPPAPEMTLEEAGEISVRKQEPEPVQPEPDRDPRLWSKPRGSSSPPPGRARRTPLPSVT
jgi:hypothetical protein